MTVLYYYFRKVYTEAICMDYTEKTLSREEIYKGRVVELHNDRILLPDGRESTREVMEHPGGVTVIPVDEQGMVTCVRQYRYPMGRHLLEVPAGKLEKDEDPLECAVRELSEETGLTAEKFIDLGRIYPSPGYSAEILYLYLALGLHPGEMHLDEGEFLDVEQHTLEELTEQIMRGELCDAKTVAAVLKAKRYLDEKGEN